MNESLTKEQLKTIDEIAYGLHPFDRGHSVTSVYRERMIAVSKFMMLLLKDEDLQGRLGLHRKAETENK